MVRLLLTACLLLAAPSGAAQEYDKESALAISQAAIGTQLDSKTDR